jgi:hypothetical protein
MKKYVSELDNNFSYGYDGLKYNFRTSENSKFNCYYGKADYIPTSFREECVKLCRDISSYAQQNRRIPYVLLSGGLDSEIVVRSFIEANVPFKVIVNRFKDDLNAHEIEYVEKFLNDKDLDIEFYDLDVVSWLQSLEALQMADDSACPYSEMLSTTKLIDVVYFERNGIPVLGNGDLYSSYIDDQWMYIEFEYILAWIRYCSRKNIQSAVNFFQLNPEVVLAMADDPLIKSTLAQNEKTTLRSTKYKVYKKYWPDVEIRTKFNGAEKIQALCDNLNQTFLNQYKIYTAKWMIPVEDFFDMLRFN